MFASIFICGITAIGIGLTACNNDNEQSFPDCGFNDIADVFREVKADEQVVFVLRHAERGEDYSPAGLLTENGKAQARATGEKIKNGEASFYAHSDYERTKQTCENIAIGRGDEFVHEQWDILHGEYFMRDVELIYANGLYSWEAASQWAYEGKFVDKGYYNLDQRAAEWLASLKAKLPTMKRINVLVTHDYVVSALAIWASQHQIDLHYWINHKWINYLAGIAVIIDKNGNARIRTVRCLNTGYLIM
jgi:broad specificity phosphatase PhoE